MATKIPATAGLHRRLTPAIVVRSVALNVAFYLFYPLAMIGGFFYLFLPRKRAIGALKWFSRVFVRMCRTLGDIDMRVEGTEHIPHDAAIVAGKHQSFWETFALFHLFDDPTIALKRELARIPLVGWFIRKFDMILVDRAAGLKALKTLLRQGEKAVREGRQIIIFPEGHRMAIHAAPDYKPGVAALYGRLGVPCVPFALNSGVFWPRRVFWRWPGVVTVRFLPPIAPGLNKRAFMRQLQEAIEPATHALVEEGVAQLRARGLLAAEPSTSLDG